MTSAPSSIKKTGKLSLFCWSVRKTLPICIMVSVIYFLIQPMVMILSDHKKPRFTIINTYETTLTLAAILSWVLVVVVASVMFSYLQNKQSVDFFHSLPLTRRGLFLSRYFAGLFIISVPIIISFLVTFLCALLLGFNFGAHDAHEINNFIMLTRLGKDLGLFLLLQTAFYTMTVFVFINTGTVLDTMISLLALNGIFPASLVLVNLFLVARLPGFANMISGKYYFMFSPFARMAAISYINDLRTVIWWTFFTAAFFTASMLQYKRRKSEFTGSAYTFALLKILFKVLIPFCGGLALAFVFTSMFDAAGVFILGFIGGAVLAYVVTESVFSRGFRTLIKSSVSLVISAGLFFSLYISVETGFFGYATRLPQRAQVESVLVLDASRMSYLVTSNMDSGLLLEQSDSIDLIYGIHEKLVNKVRRHEISKGFEPNFSRPGNFIEYVLQLRNGRKIKRFYSEEENENFLGDFYELKEYKFKTLPVNYPGVRDSDWQEIQITGAFETYNMSTVISISKEQSVELSKALRDTYRSKIPTNGSKPLGMLRIHNEKKSITSDPFYVYDQITPLTDFLKKYDYLWNFRHGSTENMYAVIAKAKDFSISQAKNIYPGFLFTAETAITHDENIIEALKGKAKLDLNLAHKDGFLVTIGNGQLSADLTSVFFVPESEITFDLNDLEFRNNNHPEISHKYIID